MSSDRYHHRWGYPYVVALTNKAVEGEAPTRIWTARQVCSQCGTTRNPITDRITAYRGWKDPQTGRHPCQEPPEGARPYPWADAEARVVRDLAAMADQGHDVRQTHPDPPGAEQTRLV